MQTIDRLLEGVDLRMIYALLVLAGVMSTVYLMQLSRHEPAEEYEPQWVRAAKRFALAMLTWALLWCLSYSYSKNWQPWPPDLFFVAALDSVILMRVFAMRAFVHRMKVPPSVESQPAIVRNLLRN